MNLLGRMGWGDVVFEPALANPDSSDLIAAGAGGVVVLGAIVALYCLFHYRLWGVFWRGWLTSLDHKRIGIMYIAFAMIMLVRGVLEGVVMRAQQADGLDGGFLTSHHYGELFSTHGTIMIFFMAMPFLTGLINIIVPLQIGARDVSFPLLNALSLAFTAAGGALIMVSLVVGEFSTGGWTGYPPYTGVAFQPGVGPDYWIWSVALAGIGTTLSGINFVTTILKERAPGMTFARLPLFTWTAFTTSVLMVFALPPLTVATSLLALDRMAGFHFFTNDLGGNMMNFANLFWLFGHPEVYILILPAFGVFSEVFATFSGKKLYGYTSLVIATVVIAVLSFTVWVHHFFTMGQSANLNAIFGIATMTIGVPTGVKIYDWMATMYRGRVRMSVPMIYSVGFIMLFVIGGLTGIILANPTVDYQVHNTLFLVAHFHNMLIPGLLFGMLAGYTFWFPKVFGFQLDAFWGRIAAWGWIVGYSLTFFPLYAVGLMGMTRRTASYTIEAFQPWMLVSGLGALVVLGALVALGLQLWVSIRYRKALTVEGGDPWDARTPEWSLPAPVPAWNFAHIPMVTARDDFWEKKRTATVDATPATHTDIALPRNSILGPLFAIGATALGFGLIWHIWWMAALAAAIMPLAIIVRSFRTDLHRVIPADEVAAYDLAFRETRAALVPVGRDGEETVANRGRANREAFE